MVGVESADGCRGRGSPGLRELAVSCKEAGLCPLAHGCQLKALGEETARVISRCHKKTSRADTGVHMPVRLRGGVMHASRTHTPNSVLQRWGPRSGSACLDTTWTPWAAPTFQTKGFKDVPVLQAWMELPSLISVLL